MLCEIEQAVLLRLNYFSNAVQLRFLNSSMLSGTCMMPAEHNASTSLLLLHTDNLRHYPVVSTLKLATHEQSYKVRQRHSLQSSCIKRLQCDCDVG